YGSSHKGHSEDWALITHRTQPSQHPVLIRGARTLAYVLQHRRRTVRLVLTVAIVVSVALLAHGAATAPTTASAESVPEAPPRENVTVVTESAKHGTIIAWRPDGSLLYYDDAHTKYFDVDPVAGTRYTVEYVATDTVHSRGPTCASPPCVRNVVERANLSTGHVETVYARYDRHERAGEWHDHVRIDDRHVLIADIIDDQVFVVNTETEVVTWLWDAQSDYPLAGGGPYPDDWTHLNDVEVLDDGRVMVSLRNQDQVVFLDRETGLLENWTLGAEDDHDVLHEQHNPDYIPAERGGPAVLVADSENGRVVEYHREGEGWRRTWEWSDRRLQWPRDADRLPNGNTLIADTHGKRVLEVAPNGTVVWSVPVSHPYDVERLGTGAESASGESARRLGLESRTGATAGEGGDPLAILADVLTAPLPSRWVNAAIYLAPVWMGRLQFFAAGVGLFAVLSWIGLELSWRLGDAGVGLRWPVYRK
ncbi:MAG: hypothetical protein ACI9YT_003116, partial [Halobacteriales archaeon]